nr:hypothetical protein [Janthinobacterium sp. Marseille]
MDKINPNLSALNNPSSEELEIMKENNAIGQAASCFWNWKYNQDLGVMKSALSQQIHLNRFFSK